MYAAAMIMFFRKPIKMQQQDWVQTWVSLASFDVEDYWKMLEANANHTA